MDIKYYKTFEQNKYGEIRATNDEEMVGRLSYIINSKRNAWLYKVEVREDYREQGIGSNLMDIFEDECASRHVNSIEGKFYPEIDGNKVRTFYERKGYSIYKADYETFVGKFFIEKKDISNLNVVEDKPLEQ